MINIIAFLKYLGIHVNVNEFSSPILLFACSILIMSILALIIFIQIILYFAIKHITDDKVLLDKISKYTLLFKIFNMYRQTSIFFILFEVLLFLYSMGIIIWLCFSVINDLM
uniref:hypothetical protein n=1 Tax=Phellinidium ferrugineofuscum TaxID=167367 RepID=UPI0023AAED73|nr:hypothetical protein P1Q01_mgp06 [Phellinidium ferrugineofuscum]WCF76820.1 hypothetical protein [Phellinidium ferrugineofuscum]